jgi:Flp pilus assembly pilin Flp
MALTVARNDFLVGTANPAPTENSLQGSATTLGGNSMSRRKRVYKLKATSRGQTMTEYALILVTIAIIAASLVQNAGTIVNAIVNHVCALF